MPEPDSALGASSNAVSYSNNIGQSTPASSTTYGLLVEGRDYEGEVPALVVSTLLKRGSRIISQIGYIREDSREFILSVTCDLARSKGTLDDLVILLRRIKHVTYAEAVSLKNQMFDGLLFPLVMMETNRVVAVSSTLMFEIQEKLKTQGEKTSLVEAGRDYGKDIVYKIKQKILDNKNARKEPVADVRAIQENVKGYMKAAGWGKFSWESEENFERIVISDPPLSAEGGSGAGNLFLHGLVAGMTEVFRNKRFSVMEDHYDPKNRRLTATLIEENRIKPVEASPDVTLSHDEKTKVLGEIEKIINYVEGKEVGEQKPVEVKVVEQDFRGKVIAIPSSDSGDKLHITLKRKDAETGSGSSMGGENVQSPVTIPNVSGENNQEDSAQPPKQPEEHPQGKIKVETTLDVVDTVTTSESISKEGGIEADAALNLGSRVLVQSPHKERLRSHAEKYKTSQNNTEKTKQTDARTLEDLRNQNDILIGLLKRKRDLHYKEYEEFAEIREDEDANSEGSWI